jgi:hypothetical protein
MNFRSNRLDLALDRLCGSGSAGESGSWAIRFGEMADIREGLIVSPLPPKPGVS